jgi:hypothetical protein
MPDCAVAAVDIVAMLPASTAALMAQLTAVDGRFVLLIVDGFVVMTLNVPP